MTEKLYYKDPYMKNANARILKVNLVSNDNIEVVLDRTIFYPSGGGQPSDRGIIKSDNFEIDVDKVYKKGEEIVHHGSLKGEKPKEGDVVNIEIDWFWRYENMKQHTGQHILSAVLLSKLGSDTTGFQIFDEHNKIEIEYAGELDWDIITKIEMIANSIVTKSINVETIEYDKIPKYIENKLRKYLSPKVKGLIRVVKIGDVDMVPCGGTHVRNTSEVGLIKVLNFYRKTSNVWRIEFVCGLRALISLNRILADYHKSMKSIGTKRYPLVKSIDELKYQYKALWEEKESLLKDIVKLKAESLYNRAEKIGNLKIITILDVLSMNILQKLATYIIDNYKSTVFVATTPKYVLLARSRDAKKIHAGKLLSETIKKFGGKGGGSEVLARGGNYRAKQTEIMNEIVKRIKEIVFRV